MFKLFGFGKKPMMRGKSKSPEAKFKEKQASVNSFLLDGWLKRLKNDPVLADRMSEQRFGTEVGMRYGGEGESDGYEGGDLLNVLRQAREAKDLLKDEMGEGKGSWLRDIADIMKSLPELLAALPQIQQAAQAQQQAQTRQAPRYIPPATQTQDQVRLDLEQPQPQNLEVSMSVLFPLLDLEPAEAWQSLQDQGEQGWIHYLSHTSLEEIEDTLKKAALNAARPEDAAAVEEFTHQKHVWLRELVEIAHHVEQT